MQPVRPVEHEDLEGRNAELIGEQRNLVDVLGQDRSHVEPVVDVGPALGGLENVGVDLGVRTGAVCAF